MAEDLLECDAFLDEVRRACDQQGVPMTAIHSEFSSGQWEINTHHVDDPLLACDHAALLKLVPILLTAALLFGTVSGIIAAIVLDLLDRPRPARP